MAKLQMLSFEYDELPRCAANCKSVINKTCWDGNTFRVSIGRPEPFDEITVELPA